MNFLQPWDLDHPKRYRTELGRLLCERYQITELLTEGDSGAVYRGPGAPANGPLHHYTFEVFALDTKLDVTAATDPFETRTNVFKAMQGHVLGKAVMFGLFRRPPA